MIVGTRIVPLGRLNEASRSVQSLIEFSRELVPRPIRHIDAVVDNQRYLVAVTLRKVKSIPYSKKSELCDGLLEGVTVRGVVNEIYDFEDLLRSVNTKKLHKYLFERE
jgi:hypothetical protein